MKKKQLFLAVQAALFTFAVGGVTAVETVSTSNSNPDSGDVVENVIEEITEVTSTSIEATSTLEVEMNSTLEVETSSTTTVETLGEVEATTGNTKIDVCHNGHIINVARTEVDEHLAHGDAEGVCSASDEELAVLECADGHTIEIPQADLTEYLSRDREEVCAVEGVEETLLEEFGEETTDVDIDIDIDVNITTGTTIGGYILDSEGNPLSNLVVAISAVVEADDYCVDDDFGSDDDDSGSQEDDDDSGSKAKDDDDSGSKAKDDDDSGSKAKDDDDSGSKAKDDDDSGSKAKDDDGSGSKAKDDDSGSKAKDDDSGSKAKDDDSGSKAKDDDDAGSTRKAEKVDICHNGHIINVAESAVAAHLAHGDSEGECLTSTEDDTSEDVVEDDTSEDGVDDSCSNEIAVMVRTDESGFYQFVGLELGVYEITVSQEIELGTTGNIVLIEVGNFTVEVSEEGSIQAPEFEIPIVNELPEGESLEDVTIMGDPEEPVIIENREIHGTVRLSFTTIVNINMGMGANLILGPGARFRHHSAIPFGLRLTNIFRPIVPPAVIRGEIRQETTIVDLSEAVVEDAPPVLEDVAAILNEGYEEGNVAIVQDSETGHLEIDFGNIIYAVVPIEVRQAAEDVAPGVHFNAMDGTISFVTLRRQEVVTYSAVQSMTDFVTGLADIGLFRLSVDMNGFMSAIDPITRIRYRGRSEFLSELVDESVQQGVYTPFGSRFVHFVFRGRGNGMRRQIIYPVSAHLEALTLESNVENVEVQSTGFVSFSMQGVSYRGVLSYEVMSGEIPESGVTEFVAGEDGNFIIIYPNGDRQTLLIQR